ncbi:4728_t:CDS:1, partial [Acaulospora colombiana]
GPSGLPVPVYALETPKPQSRLGRMRQSLGGGHANNIFSQPEKSFSSNLPQPSLTHSVMKPSHSVRRQSTRPGPPPNSLFSNVPNGALSSRTP